MGTKTVDETGADTGAEARNDDESVKGADVTKDDAATEEATTDTGDSVEADDSDETGEFDEEFPLTVAKTSPGVGQGAHAASCPWCWAWCR